MKFAKKVLTAIYWILIAALILVAIGSAFSIIKAPGGYRLFAVQSGSMEPAVHIGSLVLVIPQKNYQKNDIITFLANPNANLRKPGSTVTHRILEVHDDEGRATFTTQGDANQSSDPETVTARLVLGKVVFSLPLVGHAVAFAKTQTGLILLIIIPGSIIIYHEISAILKEIRRIIKRQSKSKT